MNKVLENTLVIVSIFLTVTLVKSCHKDFKPWHNQSVNHQPLVRRPGYPIVKKVIEDTKAMTVLISVEGFSQRVRGTGVLIDKKHVLTCYHMVHSYTDDMWIYPYPGRKVVKAHPVAGDRYHDLAILELDESVVIKHYAVFNTTTTLGEPITVIGNIEGAMRWFVSYGVISAYDDGYIVTDALILGGNSGGPWVNDAGEIVAISDWGQRDDSGPTGINGGVAAQDIVSFIDGYRHPTFNLLKLLMGAETGKR